VVAYFTSCTHNIHVQRLIVGGKPSPSTAIGGWVVICMSSHPVGGDFIYEWKPTFFGWESQLCDLCGTTISTVVLSVLNQHYSRYI
jgi:hypothetical protein